MLNGSAERGSLSRACRARLAERDAWRGLPSGVRLARVRSAPVSERAFLTAAGRPPMGNPAATGRPPGGFRAEPAAPPARFGQSYLQIVSVHRSYPQARFSTWGQVDNEARLSRQIGLEPTSPSTAPSVTLRPPVSVDQSHRANHFHSKVRVGRVWSGNSWPCAQLWERSLPMSTDLSHSLWITFPGCGFLWTTQFPSPVPRKGIESTDRIPPAPFQGAAPFSLTPIEAPHQFPQNMTEGAERNTGS